MSADKEPIGEKPPTAPLSVPKILHPGKIVWVTVESQTMIPPRAIIWLYDANGKAVQNLIDRALQTAGYVHSDFIADSGHEPFWHWVKRKLRGQ